MIRHASAEEDALERLRADGERLERLLDDIELIPGVDRRWLGVARTQLQLGFMAAARAVARPESFA